MRSLIILALPLILMGCAIPYVPVPIEVTNEAAFKIDVAECLAAGDAYASKLDVMDIGASAVTGATRNAAGAAVSPLMPLIGAAGDTTTQLITGLNIMGHASANVARHCLDEKTHRDGSAIIANPND